MVTLIGAVVCRRMCMIRVTCAHILFNGRCAQEVARKMPQCMALYSAVLSITGKLYIWVDVGCIQQRTWIEFRHKSRDDTHPFARSTRSAKAAGWSTSLRTLNAIITSCWMIRIPSHA